MRKAQSRKAMSTTEVRKAYVAVQKCRNLRLSLEMAVGYLDSLFRQRALDPAPYALARKILLEGAHLPPIANVENGRM